MKYRCKLDPSPEAKMCTPLNKVLISSIQCCNAKDKNVATHMPFYIHAISQSLPYHAYHVYFGSNGLLMSYMLMS